MQLNDFSMRSYLDLRRGRYAIDQVVGEGFLQAISTNQDVDFSRIAGEVQGGLSGGVAATDHEDILATAQLCLAGAGAVKDTRAAQPFFVPEVETAVLNTGGTDCGVHHKAGAIRQVADRLTGHELGTHPLMQQKDFCSKAVGLITGTFREVRAADALRESQVILDPGTGPRLSAYGVALDQQGFKSLGCAVNCSTEPGGPTAQDGQIVFCAGWFLKPT